MQNTFMMQINCEQEDIVVFHILTISYIAWHN